MAEYGLNQTIGPLSLATLSCGGADDGGSGPWGRDQVILTLHSFWGVSIVCIRLIACQQHRVRSVLTPCFSSSLLMHSFSVLLLCLYIYITRKQEHGHCRDMDTEI